MLGAGLDVALVPVWGWGPTMGAGHEAGTSGTGRGNAAAPDRDPDPLGHFAPARYGPGGRTSSSGPDPSSRGRLHAWRPRWRHACLAPGESTQVGVHPR